MRVLVATSTFPLDLEGGWRRFVYDLAQSLAEKVSVTVLAPGAPNAPAQEWWGKLQVRRFSYFWPKEQQRLAYGTSMVDSMRESWLAKVQVPAFLAAEAMAIAKLVRQERFDVVNSHWMVPQGLSVAAASLLGKPFKHVLSVHAGDVYFLRKLRGGAKLAQQVMQRTDAVFAAGSHVKATLDDLLGRPSGAILQPMGVDTRVFGEGPELQSRFSDGYLLFVGRFAEKKGVTYLLEAMLQVRKKFPDLGLILIGSGTLEAELKAKAKGLGLEEAVEFAGSKNHQEICKYLHGSRLSVVPSIIDSRGETEGMPTVVLEAMAAGVPVVGSRVNGIPDIIRDGENGWLCREKDPADLAEKIVLALSSKDISAFRERARMTAQRFDWSKVCDQYLNVFDRLLNGSEASAAADGL